MQVKEFKEQINELLKDIPDNEYIGFYDGIYGCGETLTTDIKCIQYDEWQHCWVIYLRR